MKSNFVGRSGPTCILSIIFTIIHLLRYTWSTDRQPTRGRHSNICYNQDIAAIGLTSYNNAIFNNPVLLNNGKGEKPCEMSPWSAWGDCSVSCGVGVQKSVRNIMSEDKNCNGLTTRSRSCTEKPAHWQDSSSANSSTAQQATRSSTHTRQAHRQALDHITV